VVDERHALSVDRTCEKRWGVKVSVGEEGREGGREGGRETYLY